MGKNLYVGNLAYSVTEDDLTEAVSEFGNVDSVKIIIDRDTGQSKGFGFIEMSSDAEANAVISGLNGKPFKGRPLKINEAKAPAQRSGGGGGGGGRRGNY
jgi:cold-inducible RNA-binding protein